MQMTDGEVVLNIMQAKDQKAQISICADLNCCSEQKIKDILKANDIDLRKLRGAAHKRVAETKKYKKRAANADKKSANTETDENKIAQALATLYAHAAELRKQRDAIDDQLVAVDIQLNRIQDIIAGRSGVNESTET